MYVCPRIARAALRVRVREKLNETSISTVQEKTAAQNWFPGEDVHGRGQGYSVTSTPQGSGQADCLRSWNMCVSCDSDGKQQKNDAKPDFGLSRSQRIAQRSVFQEAYDCGVNHVGKYMVMWLRSGEDSALRLGVVASKRTFRRAVDRARVKRLLREAYRLNRFRLCGKCDIVLVARRRMLNVKVDVVVRELLDLAERAGIMKKETD